MKPLRTSCSFSLQGTEFNFNFNFNFNFIQFSLLQFYIVSVLFRPDAKGKENRTRKAKRIDNKNAWRVHCFFGV